MRNFPVKHCLRAFLPRPYLSSTAVLLVRFIVLGVVCAGCGEPTDAENEFRHQKLSYHNDRARTGWNQNESVLTPSSVAQLGLTELWSSEQLEGHSGEAPRIFATPLYVDDVELDSGTTAPLIYAATGTGYVYAISAASTGDPIAGSIVWRRKLTDMPCRNGRESILSTPVIDNRSRRIYVVSCDTDEQYAAHALDLASGRPVDGWPVGINHRTVNRDGINANGANAFPDNALMYQRGALNLSADGSRLYVPFGNDRFSGWLVVVDTDAASVASAFSSTAVAEEHQGGMWSSSGPSIDDQGRIYIATGASVVFARDKAGVAGVFPDSNNNWGQSVIQLSDSKLEGLKLIGTYTPFDYCEAQAADIDLGSSGTLVIDLNDSESTTARLLALVGGKQGNAYLLDRDNMPGSLTRRPSCSSDSRSDMSLLSPDIQLHFGQRGPISVFGPYSANHGWFDLAKSRTTAAHFRSEDGTHYLFATGNTKKAADSVESIPPSLVRLRIVTTPGAPAWLEVDKQQQHLVFRNPGSPVITSNGSMDAVVWVLDTNAPRSISLWDDDHPPRPVLYAIDALTLELLWKSEEGVLMTSGKYNEPSVVDGKVFVGTDRIQVFGLPNEGKRPQAAGDTHTR